MGIADGHESNGRCVVGVVMEEDEEEDAEFRVADGNKSC